LRSVTHDEKILDRFELRDGRLVDQEGDTR
jgi:hypothetical protein